MKRIKEPRPINIHENNSCPKTSFVFFFIESYDRLGYTRPWRMLNRDEKLRVVFCGHREKMGRTIFINFSRFLLKNLVYFIAKWFFTRCGNGNAFHYGVSQWNNSFLNGGWLRFFAADKKLGNSRGLLFVPRRRQFYILPRSWFATHFFPSLLLL